jgi:hypothetical protein
VGTVSCVRTLKVTASASLAAAALLLGHEVAYRLFIPSTSQRHAHLTATGHSWLPLLLPTAVMALAAVVASGLLAGMRHVDRRRAFTAHALLQTAVYIGIEFSERALSGMGVAGALQDILSRNGLSLLLVGVVAQLVAALLLSAAFRVAVRLGKTLRSRKSAPADAPSRYFARYSFAVSAQFLSCVVPRGPPAFSPSATVVAA